MSQGREPNDLHGETEPTRSEIDRELISMNRRLTRLEDSQVTGRELKDETFWSSLRRY